MNDLLKIATDAHGGVERWSHLTELKAHLSITGGIWQAMGKPDLLKDVWIELSLHEERIKIQCVGQDKRFVFTPQRISLENEKGKIIEMRDNPRRAFAAVPFGTPWDDFPVVYFAGHALWTYLTIPFLYTYSGFVTEELPTWREDGEEWRPLKAIFPESVDSHSREQISYFGQDGLLRRHEYIVDMMGGAKGVNYAYNYRQIDGIMVPTARRIVNFDENKRKIPDPVLVAIDIQEMAFDSKPNAVNRD